jgi:chromosome segregation ATPase
MTTGIDVDQQNRFVNALRDTLEYLDFVAIAYSNMEVRARGYRKEARELEKGIARLRTEEATLEVQLSDTTKSLKEREEITKKLQQVNERRAQKQIQIARNELKIINEKLSFESKAGKEREALLDQQLTAYQNLSEAQRELAQQRAEGEKEQNELMQDYLERELDILIDGFDNQKTINEKKIASDLTPLVNVGDYWKKQGN